MCWWSLVDGTENRLFLHFVIHRFPCKLCKYVHLACTFFFLFTLIYACNLTVSLVSLRQIFIFKQSLHYFCKVFIKL